MKTNITKVKKRIFEIVQTANPDDCASKIFDVGIIALIIINDNSNNCKHIQYSSMDDKMF